MFDNLPDWLRNLLVLLAVLLVVWVVWTFVKTILTLLIWLIAVGVLVLAVTWAVKRFL